MKKSRVLCFIALFLFSTILYAENTVSDFEEDWALSFFVNCKMGIFNGLESIEYSTDAMWYIGFGLRYKTISAQLSMSRSTFDEFNFWSFDIELDSYFNKVYYEAYFKRYQDLIAQEISQNDRLDIHSSGIMAKFLQNNENHSLSSVNKLDKIQNISSGSIIYGFGVFHTSFFSSTGSISKYENRQHLLYFGPCIGYSYTWVFGNGFFLNPSLFLFLNPGINISTDNWLFIPQLEPKIVVGYHHDTWSANIIMKNNAQFMIWNRNDIDILTLVSISVVFSKRF